VAYWVVLVEEMPLVVMLVVDILLLLLIPLVLMEVLLRLLIVILHSLYQVGKVAKEVPVEPVAEVVAEEAAMANRTVGVLIIPEMVDLAEAEAVAVVMVVLVAGEVALVLVFM
jgi:hypothetical protein